MCDYPKIRYYNDNILSDTGKPRTLKIITLKKEDRRYQYEIYDKLESEQRARNGSEHWQKIPCGQCWSCRLEHSRQWAERIVLEQKAHPEWECYFLTLTYSPYTLPPNMDEWGVIEDLGNGGSLYKTDMTLFIKRLRKYWKDHYGHEGIRFFYCGEYGEKGMRAHYHMIVMNLPHLMDYLEFYKLTRDKNILYKEKYIDADIEKEELFTRLWKLGFVTVGEVNYNTAAYVARYTMKKVFRKEDGIDEHEWYAGLGKRPEFINMSRRPGIGKDYFDMCKDEIYKNDEVIIKTEGKNGNIKVKKLKPPSYYDKLYDIEEHEILEQIKARRKQAIENEEMLRKAAGDTRTHKEYLQDKARAARSRTEWHRNADREEGNWIDETQKKW